VKEHAAKAVNYRRQSVLNFRNKSNAFLTSSVVAWTRKENKWSWWY